MSSEWTEEARRQIASWGGLTPNDATAAGMFEVSDASALHPSLKPWAAIVIPYYAADGSPRLCEDGKPFFRVRYLNASRGFGKVAKYMQPPKTGTAAYFAPILDWQAALRDRQPVLITEGEAKALRACVDGFPAIGIGGVFNWGSKRDGLLPELRPFAESGVPFYIIFDSDVQTNPQIQLAERRLAEIIRTQYNCDCHLVRLPAREDGKEALDTFLERAGPAALDSLLGSTPSLSPLERKILKLNKDVAWIEEDSLPWSIKNHFWLKTSTFASGNEPGVSKHTIAAAGTDGRLKEISVAKAWLTSPLANRYSQILFRPGQPEVFRNERGNMALNMWTGWNYISGVGANDRRVAAFLRLHDFLFSRLPPAQQELAFKLLAYRVQNPATKIPLAYVTIGQQGCGKSLWGECLSLAMAPWSAQMRSKEFGYTHTNQVEKTLWVSIDEAEPEHMERYIDVLKNMITGLDATLNEKFRPVRQIKSYSMYYLNSNRHGVASQAFDDRRFFTNLAPPTDSALEDVQTYLGRAAGSWVSENGPQALLGYLLAYDLKGWRPPPKAPQSQEKLIAYEEGMTPIQRLAHEMRTADGNTVFQWLLSTYNWAKENSRLAGDRGIYAAALEHEIMHYSVKDFYTAKELAKIFPNVLYTAGATKAAQTANDPSQISRQLRDAGVQYLASKDDPRGFMYHGHMQQFLIVANADEWRDGASQRDFERHVANAPTFGTLLARAR